jgi:hypothetical protein
VQLVLVKMRYGKIGKVADTPGDPRKRSARASWRPSRIVDDLLGARLEESYLEWLVSYGAEQPIVDLLNNPDLATIVETGDEQGLGGWLELAIASAAGFLVPSDPGLFMRWRSESASGKAGKATMDLERQLAALQRQFVAAVTAASRGELSPLLADELAAVRRKKGGMVEVDTLAQLGAWCLEYLLRDGPVSVRECHGCGYLWIGERAGRFCVRPAPGQKTTCRALRSYESFAAANPDFNRERRRLYERRRRGSLTVSDYHAWKDKNHPGERGTDWLPYEEWLAVRQESSFPG